MSATGARMFEKRSHVWSWMTNISGHVGGGGEQRKCIIAGILLL